MKNYSGNKKNELLKIKNNNNFRVNVVTWIDGVLNKVDYFFDDFEESKKFSKTKKGKIKIYTKDNQLIHTENEEHPQHRKKDDDSYA